MEGCAPVLAEGSGVPPISGNGGTPRPEGFTERGSVAPECRVTGVYSKGSLTEFVWPGLGARVLPTVGAERSGDREPVGVAPGGAGFAAIEHETGCAPVAVRRDRFAGA